MEERKEIHYTTKESIACDVLMNHASLSRVTFLTELAVQALFLLNLASTSSRCMAEYLLAASACRTDSSRVLCAALEYLHNHIQQGGGNSSHEGYHLIMMVSVNNLVAVHDHFLIYSVLRLSPSPMFSRFCQPSQQFQMINRKTASLW